MPLFTIGPTQLYPTVSKHIKTAIDQEILSISHRSDEFIEIYKSADSNLRKLLEIPQDHKIFFVSSATDAMERIIQNCVESSSLHLVNGAFSERFFQISNQLAKNALKIRVEEGEDFDFNKITIPQNAELVCFTQNETSTGVQIAPEEIYSIMRSNPESLVCVDITSSAPCVQIDYSKIDLAFFSIQKGFGLPAGLGVLIVSPKAYEKSITSEEQGLSTGSYRRFSNLDKYAQKYQNPETPNVLAIYLLNKVCGDLQKKGIDRIRKEIDKKADLLYQTLDGHKTLPPYIKKKKARSKTIIVVDSQKNTARIIDRLKKSNIEVSTGYKEKKDTQLRIGNFPSTSLEEWEDLIKAFLI